MRDGNGYLLPDNPAPEGLICLKLYIPNDPTGFYLAAMSGAFSDMGRWLQWEKDGTDRASLAASTWKDAIDYTYEHGWLNCMDCCDDIEDIIRRIEELENMNITVNCGCGCGGCGGCGGNGESFQDLSQEPGYEPFPDEPIILPGETLNNLCDVANQWADGVTETMQRMKSFFGGISVTAASVQAFIGSILKLKKFALILSPALFIQLIVGAIAVVVSANLTDEASDAAQEFENDFKCAIFRALTPQQAKTNVLAVVKQIRESYGVMVASLFYAIVMITDWRKATIENEGLILPEYIGMGDCSDCGTTTPLELAGDWWLVPAIEGVEEVSTGDITVTDYVWAYSDDVGGGAESYPSIAEFLDGFSFPGTLDDSGHLAGFVIQKMAESVNATFAPLSIDPMIAIEPADYLANDIFTKYLTLGDLTKGQFQSAVEDAFPGASFLHTPDRTSFNNASQRRVAVKGVDVEPSAATFRVWLVVAGAALNL